MALKKIDVEKFLKLAESIPVIDVRSPSEFNAGHIPGAVNIPLFNDTERIVLVQNIRRRDVFRQLLRD